MCHCRLSQAWHGDVIIRRFSRRFHGAFNREEMDGVVLSSMVLNYMSRLREEPERGDEPSADEGVPHKGSGWRGLEEAMLVGVGHTSRELCDGLTLASPGRWPMAKRRYPKDALRTTLAAKFMNYADRHGTPELLMKLALGRVDSCAFESELIEKQKDAPVESRERSGSGVGRFRGRGSCGIGCSASRVPTLYPRKKKWRLPRQTDPLDYTEENDMSESFWRQNDSSLEEYEEQVLDVMIDQAKCAQFLRLLEEEARRRFPGLAIASSTGGEAWRCDCSARVVRWYPRHCCQSPDSCQRSGKTPDRNRPK